MRLRGAQTHENNKIYLFIRMVGLYFELLLSTIQRRIMLSKIFHESIAIHECIKKNGVKDLSRSHRLFFWLILVGDVNHSFQNNF